MKCALVMQLSCLMPKSSHRPSINKANCSCRVCSQQQANPRDGSRAVRRYVLDSTTTFRALSTACTTHDGCYAEPKRKHNS